MKGRCKGNQRREVREGGREEGRREGLVRREGREKKDDQKQLSERCRPVDFKANKSVDTE